MPMRVLGAFWVVSLLFVITPGVDWAYAIAAGIRGGVVLPAVLGLVLGHLLATLVVAAGVGTLVAANPVALDGLTTLGAAYLLWLGLAMLFRTPALGAGETQRTASWAKWASKGVCVSGLNPKVFLLFLALLPEFTEPTAPWSIPAQIITLGWVHIANCSMVYLLVGLGAQAVLQARPQMAQCVSRLSGLAMIVLAAGLIAERLLH